MRYRDYDPSRDREAIHRIWTEVGWLHQGQEAGLDTFISGARTIVAGMRPSRSTSIGPAADGTPECAVATFSGNLTYQGENLPFTLVGNVATSRVARGQGLARRVAAQSLANAALDGSLVAGLGMFEQGFYNHIGFGAGSYEHYIHFDPADLLTTHQPPAPVRLSAEDWADIHASRAFRHRWHGSISLDAPQFTHADLHHGQGFGLGYRDSAAALTHHFWCETGDTTRRGPYFIKWMAYRTPAQFAELVSLLRSLGDQIHMIGMRELAGVQMQDLVRQPLKKQRVSLESPRPYGIRSMADWQMRILDLPGCLARTHLPGPTLRFNLRLSDPVERFLDDDVHWRGLGGEYLITVGPESTAMPGQDTSLPRLEASVGAFSRMWLGVRSPSGLSLTDDLRASPDLLRALDEVFRLPAPRHDWGDF